MRQSPVHGICCDDAAGLDWNLVCAVERLITGADIHDGRALLCMYRDAAEYLQRHPESKYGKSKLGEAEKLLRALLAQQTTVTQAYVAKRDWYIREGKTLWDAEER